MDRNEAFAKFTENAVEVLAVDAWSRGAVNEAAAQLRAKAPAALPA